MDEKLARHKKRKKRILTGILAIVGVLAIAVTAFFTAYVADCQITEVSMDRKKRLRMSFFHAYDQRFFYQFFRKLTHSQKQLNGVASYRMEFSPDLSVKVIVTENPIIGAVSWEHNRYYFDRYGYVMAKNIDISSTVPVVDGSNFTNVSLYEQLGGVKSSLAEDILQLTQLLDDNEIAADSISYDEKMQAVIALGDVKVSLGSRDNMTDKIAELCAIMDSGELSGLKGTLHLENCGDGSTSSYIFDRE